MPVPNDTHPKLAAYAHPERLVTTEWLAGHLTDPQVRVLEVDYDPSASYELGHIPGAVLVDWKRDINDTVRRDILSKGQFEQLLSRIGATPETTLVLYGDFRNWFAAFAFWTFRIYGHADIRLLNGGRRKWIDEGREVTEETPSFTSTSYRAAEADTSIRSFRGDVEKALGAEGRAQIARVQARFFLQAKPPAPYRDAGNSSVRFLRANICVLFTADDECLPGTYGYRVSRKLFNGSQVSGVEGKTQLGQLA